MVLSAMSSISGSGMTGADAPDRLPEEPRAPRHGSSGTRNAGEAAMAKDDRDAGAPVSAGGGLAPTVDPTRDPDDNYGAGAAGGRIGPEAGGPPPDDAEADEAFVAWRNGRAGEDAAAARGLDDDHRAWRASAPEGSFPGDFERWLRERGRG
jgi:hypothetical protein